MTEPSLALDTLGVPQLPDGAERDAIHLAVVPAIAGETLAPGDWLTYDPTTERAKRLRPGDPDAVGIVDPFLLDYVVTDQRFWLIVRPRTITGLRHVWTHPAFPEGLDKAGPDPEPVAVIGGLTHTQSESHNWLVRYLGGMGLMLQSPDDGYEDSIDTLIARAAESDDQYLVLRGIEDHGTIDPAFWDHVEAYTGAKVPVRATYWSCSC